MSGTGIYNTQCATGRATDGRRRVGVRGHARTRMSRAEDRGEGECRRRQGTAVEGEELHTPSERTMGGEAEEIGSEAQR